ncbi:hypothetical protein CFK38_02850 [Brachybacterium vulturis]|uniref:Uncharacterized protein n=1 Tax=Brachybacterium vulturis TaxID=2017484 RepID=A0A291GK55_9MICO|nr:hypothetical protein [Brachybacterium vulturis]ATG50575.1 hypothetical protein CFK38_02850 [Brachybacterium vulturis]
MSTDLPAGSGPQEDRDGAPAAGQGSAAPVPVVMVVSAPWAGPSRPAPTVLRELGRRWGSAVQVLLVEDPSEQFLEDWSVEVLPTWLKLLPGTGPSAAGVSEELILGALTGTDLTGLEVTLAGPWHLEHRRTGAQPKHVIDAEFGPGH